MPEGTRNTSQTTTGSVISSRAQSYLEQLRPSIFPTVVGPYYDPELHPDGTINLSTAENSLLTDEVIPLLHQGEIQPQHLKYRATLLKSSVPQLADLLPRYVNLSGPVRPITRDNSVAGPGIGALLANLIWTLCDEGDGVLLSTPYYSDYSRDIHYPARAKTVLARVPPEVDSLSPAVIPILREQIHTSKAEGVPVKCLILCNPHNPLPRYYPLDTIEGYIRLAEEFNLHLIVDQVFAYSIFPTKDNPHPPAYTSIFSLALWKAANSPLLQRIHVLAGPTKDLGCSGVKAGLLITENASVRTSVTSALRATPMSGLTDALLSGLLGDERQLRGLLARNQRLLGQAMDFCAEWARFHRLPYVGANSGVYFILDLSPVAQRLGLAGAGTEGTIAIMKLMQVNKVHINPTALDEDVLPNRFRFIFSQKREVLKLALRRLETAFGLGAWEGIQ